MLGSAERAVRALGAWLPLAALTLASCGPSATERPPAATAPASSEGTASADAPKPPWEACYSTFGPTGDAEGDLARLVRDCGATGGMRPVTTVRVGTQSDRDPVDRYTFEVPAPGKCYRVYAAADAAVQDLDLLLRGPTGAAVIADVTHDSWPVLPPRGPVCFPEAGLYMLEVSVYRGAGRYALQVWGR
jgi:hypothetical protein